jgi:hypothetical protein
MDRSLLGRLASVGTIKGMRDLMRTQPATMAVWVRNVRAVEEALGSDEALSYTRLLLAAASTGRATELALELPDLMARVEPAHRVRFHRLLVAVLEDRPQAALVGAQAAGFIEFGSLDIDLDEIEGSWVAATPDEMPFERMLRSFQNPVIARVLFLLFERHRIDVAVREAYPGVGRRIDALGLGPEWSVPASDSPADRALDAVAAVAGRQAGLGVGSRVGARVEHRWPQLRGNVRLFGPDGGASWP